MQGRGEEGERLLHDAKVLQAAGAFSVVLECVPAPLATLVTMVTRELSIPTVGIGAGPGCGAQVLVWQDMAGLSPRVAKFVKKYADVASVLSEAATAFAEDVTGGAFPTRRTPTSSYASRTSATARPQARQRSRGGTHGRSFLRLNVLTV